MEHAPCNVIYVNKRLKDQVLNRSSNLKTSGIALFNGPDGDDSKLAEDIYATLESILASFTTGMLASTPLVCLSS
jgi:hypothetical protein